MKILQQVFELQWIILFTNHQKIDAMRFKSWIGLVATVTRNFGGGLKDLTKVPSMTYINIIIQTLLYIPGIFCIQASKASSLGGQQVLDCALHFPNNQRVPYIIEWKKDGLDGPVYIQHDGFPPNIHRQFAGRVRLVNEISLEISHIKEPDEGWYECKVIYLNGIEDSKKGNSNGTWIYLNVYIPPKILSSSPQSFHQPLGSMVKIFCKADGSPKPNITWSKDNRPLLTSSRMMLQNEGREVIITSLQENDGGIFKCTFRNTVGMITQTIHLIVEGQAYIIGPPSNKTAVLGQRITFTCEARGYPANITYRWYKDNRNVNTLPGYGTRIVIHDNDGSLVITIVEKEDMGWYLCRPSNGVGQDPEASAYLNITYKPVVLIDRMPHNLIWALGFREKLDCPVDANPPAFEVVWTKNGVVIEFHTSRVTRLENGTMLVAGVENSDAGNYRCTAISSFGTGDSEIVQVEVKDPPRFTLRPDAQYIRQPAQSVVMPCAAVGTPFPTIKWRRAVGNLEFDGRIRKVGSNLTIQGLQKSDHGVYECEASNEVRKIVTSTELVIQNTTPHAPYNISADTKLFSATVRWIPAYSSTPQHFLIWYRSVINNSPSQWQTMRVEPQNTTRFTLYNMEPDTLYQFKVLSRNELGNGQFSTIVEARTLGYIDGIANELPTDADGNQYYPTIVRPLGPRPSSPVDIKASYSDKGIHISWNEPINSSVKIFRYGVEYNSGNTWVQVERVRVPATSFLFKPTETGVTYKFRVYSYGTLAYSIPSEVVMVKIPADEGFGLSNTEIGGIVGGLLFLFVAVVLAVVAVLCSKRRDRHKRQTKYGNVKYLGPQDDIDARPEHTPEWSNDPQHSIHRGGDTLASHQSGTLGRDNGIFMVPKSGEIYNGYNTGRLGDPRFYNRDNYFYDPDTGRKVPYNPEHSRSYSGQPDVIDHSNGNQSLSRRSRKLNHHDDDDNGFIDVSGLRQSPAKYRSRSQPGVHRSTGPNYPVPDRPRSRGHSLHSDNASHPEFSFPDDSGRYHPQSFQNIPRQQYPTLRTPLLSPVSQGQGHPRSYPSYHDDDDEEVFMPPPLSSILSEKPGFPRHSSMKPGVKQTYLTEDLDSSRRPFLTSDISSVLPSPFSDSHAREPYHPYQREYPNSYVPYENRSRLPDYSRNGSFGDADNTVVARQPSPEKSMSRTLLGEESSSESSGRPTNYTRDHLQGVVDRVRKGPRAARKGPSRNSRGSGSELDSLSESPSPGGHGAQIPESVKPSVIVKDRPSRGYPYEKDFYKGPSVGDSRTSENSSGLGSNASRGRVATSAGLDSRSYGRDDLTPDSISSGIGSRNTSSQLTGSSLHSRPSRLGSNLIAPEHDVSEDSPFLDYPSAPMRKDISGDENYEFDSYNAVESDLLEALKNYSEVHNGNDDLLNALQDGLNTTGLFSELYPKPTKQSRYSDSEQRFEKLRGEFQKYRQKQQDQRSPSYDQGQGHRGSMHSSRGSGSDYLPFKRPSINSSMNYGYDGVMGDNSAYKAGPMDSDML